MSQLSGSLSPDGRLLSSATTEAASVHLATYRLPGVVPVQSSPAVGGALWCPAAGWLPGTRTPLVAVAVSNQLESGRAAVAAGPSWSLLGTRTSWWAWHAGRMLAGVVVLLGVGWAFGWVRRRRRQVRVSAGRSG